MRTKMSTTPATLPETLKIQKGIYDLTKMEKVTVIKEVPKPSVESASAALALLGGDHSKLLEVINEGLATFKRREENANPENWFYLNDDKTTGEAYSGNFGDQADVQKLILSIAVSAFGYSSDMTPKEKAEAKEGARQLIKDSPKLVARLVAQASTPKAESTSSDVSDDSDSDEV